ncbi:DHHW family protein [Oscillospiraceae bacterium LTW-04]|nr:DHHW family protein [Oscillospiraceae bacterium MB24-C1]
MKDLKRYPVIILLFGLIGIFFIANLLVPAKTFSEMENRYLNQLPKFSLSAIMDSTSKGYAQKFEQYANDQFALRDQWISLKSRCEALLGKTENNGIVYGKKDYLFEKYRTFDAQRLEKNLGYLEEFSALNPDVNKYIMIVPGSYNILSDLVPVGLGNIDQLPLIEEVNSRLAKSGYTGVDVSANLLAHADEDIYYRTDHHWTTQGAWYGYERFAHAMGLAAIIPQQPLAQSAEGFWGTYYSKAKKYDAMADTITWYDLPVNGVTIDGEAFDSMYDMSALDTRDKYALFLHANNGVTVIKNDSAPEGAVMVIKDSYANCFVPFLTQNFHKVVVVDLRSLPKGVNELVKTEQIRNVLVLYSFSNLSSDANLPRIRY